MSRTTYAALYAAIGDTYGAGDGSTTFALPDLECRVVVGAGGTGTTTLADTVGATGGAETHTLTVAEMPARSHGARTGSGGTHSHGSGSLAVAGSGMHTHGLDTSRQQAAGGVGLHTIKVPQNDPGHDVTTATGGSHTHTITGSVDGAGGHIHEILARGGGTHSSLQPSMVMHWIISTG